MKAQTWMGAMNFPLNWILIEYLMPMFAAKTCKVNDSKKYIFNTNDAIGFLSNAYLIFFLGTEMSRNKTSNGLQP